MNMLGQETEPTGPKKQPRGPFHGSVKDYIECRNDGEIVALSETIYLPRAKVPSQGPSHSRAGAHYAAEANHPKPKFNSDPVNETEFSQGGHGGGPGMFHQHITGTVRETRNCGNVIANRKVVYYGTKANEVFREESGTLDNKGVLQGMVGDVKTSEPKADEKSHSGSTKTDGRRERGQVKVASGSKPKD